MGIDVSGPGGVNIEKNNDDYAQQYKSLTTQEQATLLNTTEGFLNTENNLDRIIDIGSVLDSSQYTRSDLAELLQNLATDVGKMTLLADKRGLSGGKMADALADSTVDRARAQQYIYNGGFTRINEVFGAADKRYAYKFYEFGDYDGWSSGITQSEPNSIGGNSNVIWMCIPIFSNPRFYELDPEGFSTIRDVSTPSSDRYYGIGGDESHIYAVNDDQSRIEKLNASDFSIEQTRTEAELGITIGIDSDIGGNSSSAYLVNGQSDTIYELGVSDLSIQSSTSIGIGSDNLIGVGGTSTNVYATDARGNLHHLDSNLNLLESTSLAGVSSNDHSRVGGGDDVIWSVLGLDGDIASLGGP